MQEAATKRGMVQAICGNAFSAKVTAAASDATSAAGDRTVKYDTFTSKYKQVTKGTAKKR